MRKIHDIWVKNNTFSPATLDKLALIVGVNPSSSHKPKVVRSGSDPASTSAAPPASMHVSSGREAVSVADGGYYTGSPERSTKMELETKNGEGKTSNRESGQGQGQGRSVWGFCDALRVLLSSPPLFVLGSAACVRPPLVLVSVPTEGQRASVIQDLAPRRDRTGRNSRRKTHIKIASRKTVQRRIDRAKTTYACNTSVEILSMVIQSMLFLLVQLFWPPQ